MVKKSDMSLTSKPELEEKDEVSEREQPPIKVEPHFTLTTPAPDLTPVVEAMKEMVAKQEPMVVQIEKDRKPKAFRVTVTKRAFNGLIEEFECKEIT